MGENEMLTKLKSMIMKIYITMHEKKYWHVKYLFVPSFRSNKLVIVFSGFPGGGGTAQYNYIRTLSDFNVNRLYLLDEYGWLDNPGTYYLGENKDFFLIEEIRMLVDMLCRKHHIESIITVGSSKGGTSAIFYGLLLNAEYVVAGAPQYYIGDYLNTDKHRPILEKIMGDSSQESIIELNSLLLNRIKESAKTIKTIYLHYSPSEHTYNEHIQYLIADLRNNGFSIIEDCKYTYQNHKDVALYFPQHLKATVRNILNKENI